MCFQHFLCRLFPFYVTGVPGWGARGGGAPWLGMPSSAAGSSASRRHCETWLLKCFAKPLLPEMPPPRGTAGVYDLIEVLHFSPLKFYFD